MFSHTEELLLASHENARSEADHRAADHRAASRREAATIKKELPDASAGAWLIS